MAIVPDIGGTISSLAPKFSLGSSNIFLYITIFLLFILIAGGIGFGVWVLIRYLQFNRKIDIYEDRYGVLEWVGKDRAKEMKYNIYGDTVFFLRKRKKYLPRPEFKIGRNRYAYAIMPDGEWVNIRFHELNKNMKTAGVTWIHPDMRAFKAGTGKIMKDRYEKKSGFLATYLPILLPIIYVVVTSLALYFIVDKIVVAGNNLNTMTTAAKEVMDKAGQVLSSVSNICSNSGFTGG